MSPVRNEPEVEDETVGGYNRKDEKWTSSNGEMKCGTAALTAALPHHGIAVEGGAVLPHNLGQ